MANEGAAANNHHDVYISFRREETNGIVTSLCHALQDRGLIVYTDNELPDREDFPSSLPKVIESSRFSIVIFSENYLTFTSLKELEKILECKKKRTQLVYPIFYNVDRDDIWNRRGCYAHAMAEHERRFGTKMVENVIKVAYLKGWTFKFNGDETQYEFVQKLVNSITEDLKWNRISRPQLGYDVYINFSEIDTGCSFTDFLYHVLQREGFRTFRDDGTSGAGNQFSQSKIDAMIEKSKISIIVFSENYATSICRLDSLVKILDCNNQRILPIFYKVQPSDVRYQTSHYYTEAMDKHESKFGKESEKVKKWRAALFEVSNFSGWHFETGYEYQTMEKVVTLVKEISLPRYDIFLSFRGADTRHTFTGYLYYALCKKGFKTFIDDKDLKGGERISETLINAIKESRVAIIVFSEKYAFSSWCLDELVHIIDKTTSKHQRVWPIYYKVEPSDVWHQKNNYEKAMATHETMLGKERVKKWKSALSKVAKLEKWHLETGRYEFEFIESIVEKISKIYLLGDD